eukprot:gene10994-12157_t
MSLKRPYDLAAFTGSVTVEKSSTSAAVEPIPTLKLRVKDVKISDVHKAIKDIHGASKPTEKLNALLNISNICITELSVEEAGEIIRVLRNSLLKENDQNIRGKTLNIVAELFKVPNFYSYHTVDEFIEIAQKEEHHLVIVQYLKLFCIFGQLSSIKADVIQKILKFAYNRLVDSHQDVRSSCLWLMSKLCPKENLRLSAGRHVDFSELFGEFSEDQDPRVRSSALQALLTLHYRGHNLLLNIYKKASDALQDDYEAVRMGAVKLIWVLSHIYPNSKLESASQSDVRLVDDAFVKICTMVNDGSMKVRAEAMGLLGSLHMVSPVYLEQTLDKKLMSHLKKKKSAHEKERERFQGIADGWSNGRKWGANDPPTDSHIDEMEVSLMNIGACGVFVRGLEDEFKEVRTAAVDSLCELANQNASFAAMSCDFLVDMFNDEIQGVRLNSINSLIKISEHVDLREEQVDTVLNVLNEYHWEIREAVRELLAHCHLSTKACLHATVLALMLNMKKYPQDRCHIWSCMKSLGSRHPETVSSLIPDLLSTHPYYAIPEPNLDDPEYTAMAILVFNAAVRCPAVRSLLPEHTKRHYDYLRDSLPDLMPELRAASNFNRHQREDNQDITSFYRNTLERARNIGNLELPAACKAIQVCMEDLSHVQSVSNQLAANARFQALYLRCVNVLYNVRSARTWTVPTPITAENNGVLTSAVEELLSLSYRLEYAFLGLGSHDCASVKLMRVLAHCLQMVLTSRSSSIKSMDRKQHDLDCLQLFLRRIRHFRESMTAVGTTHDTGLQSILRCEQLLEEASYSMTKAVSNLQGLLLNCLIRPINVENPLREIKATINEPDGSSDAALKFTAGLTLGINLDAVIENVDDTSNVFIQVIYPDMKAHLIKPKPSEFRRLRKLKHRLVSKVIISHQTWTDSSNIQISIVTKHPTDVDEERVLSFLHPKISADKTVRHSKSSNDDVTSGIISMCEPVRLNVQPKTWNR